MKKQYFDLVVIGGGHAGVEAVLAGKRMGLNVALITLDKNKTGRMSCNPAIGGIGKTHLAKEIDALGGYMAEATDLSGIQFRTLNKKKGPAVQAVRAQADKNLYEKTIQAKIKKEQIATIDNALSAHHFPSCSCHAFICSGVASGKVKCNSIIWFSFR